MSRRPGCCTSSRSARLPGGLALIAHPLMQYAAELAADHQAESPQYQDEWDNLLGVVYALAGATGLLAMAEENVMPRVLEDLTGPMPPRRRCRRDAAPQRRVAAGAAARPGRGVDDDDGNPNTLY